MPKLTITEKGADKKIVHELETPNGATIGRATENAIVLPTSGVSRRHAHITIEGNDCFLIDLGSPNGTNLNGVKLKPNEKVILRHGDIISIENFNLHFNQIDELLANSFNEITDSDILEVKLLKKVLHAIDKESIPSIEVLNGNFAGKKMFLTEEMQEGSLGRDPTCEFPVEEYVISRRHAKLTVENGVFFIADLNSKNGTYLNNRRITKEELHDGDRIALGTIVLIFRNPKEANLEAISEAAKMKAKKTEKSPPIPPFPATTALAGREKGGGGGILEEHDLSSTGEAKEEPAEIGEFLEEEQLEYPTPAPRREWIKLSAVEMGLIGLGLVILVFATISLANLLIK